MAGSDALLVRGLGSAGDLDGPSAVLVEDGRIAALGPEAERRGGTSGATRVVDAPGLVAAPGFVELQLNGIAGHDFTTEPGAMWQVGAALARHGVTAFLPTIVTAPPGTVEAALEIWRGGEGSPGAAVPIGLHVEGPYIAPSRHGAHDRALVTAPDLDRIRAWLAQGGLRILTLAPELPGGLEAIGLVAEAGVVAAIGHTDADAATTARALDAGARYATHLFNAMRPLRHRQPGAPGALLADERATLGLIVDGQHLDPIVVGLVARLAPGRVSLVSDAMAALGLPDGTHRLGEREVAVSAGAARLSDGTLAGSVAGLDEGVRAYARITGSARSAIEAVTTVPRRLLGLGDGRGELRVGGRADLVLLDADLGVRATYVAGLAAWEADE